ncbi:MAG: sel1 repeat family protein [Endomicrobium sp.]|uniref:tetratricopeptide repeat protein n=1 Tax=Candidatus Endomicrobiellum pyrsonymphae TaxID=1408203 RepID=UPI00358C3C7F|nr:sel1 repeat family protein [Endomicrobium sp.]
MYYKGAGEVVKQNYIEALKWFQKAAANESVVAQYNLGVMYYRGLGVVQPNYTEALKWFQKAAEKGHVGAQRVLKEWI